METAVQEVITTGYAFNVFCISLQHNSRHVSRVTAVTMECFFHEVRDVLLNNRQVKVAATVLAEVTRSSILSKVSFASSGDGLFCSERLLTERKLR